MKAELTADTFNNNLPVSPLDGRGNLGPQRNRDEAMLEDLQDLLHSDSSLRQLSLQFFVRGGIAHVGGAVPDTATQERVRQKIARLRNIHGVWDILTTPDQTEPFIIDLGCGKQKQIPWATGVDAYPFEGVEVVTDLEQGLPFEDNQVDQVYAVHFLEHVKNLLPLMDDIHRVLKPDGILHLMVPHSCSGNAVADPTHVRFFNRQTVRYFCEEHPPGKVFRPLCASNDSDTVYADLRPVQPGEALPSMTELARFFD